VVNFKAFVLNTIQVVWDGPRISWCCCISILV